MRYFLLLCTLSTLLLAQKWDIADIFLTTENDADWRTDRDYTYGGEIGALFEYEKKSFVSFSLAHQMFTPNDFDKEKVDLSKERPYAGYMYIGAAYHTITSNKLDSFNMQFGFVGPSVKMDQVQKIIHSIIGSPKPKGWDEQIGDEFIAQINYERRWFNEISPLFGNDSNLVYYAGGNLGNASIKGVGGVYYRVGWNMPKDFAPRRIDYRGYPNLPLQSTLPSSKQSFSLGLWAEGAAVGRDIFLDGNSFKESVSVDKEIFVAKGGFSLSYRYKRFFIDYFRTFSTKEFKTQSYYHHYGTFHISYRYK